MAASYLRAAARVGVQGKVELDKLALADDRQPLGGERTLPGGFRRGSRSTRARRTDSPAWSAALSL